MDAKKSIELGIAAYKHEQNVLLRLLRKRGTFTSTEFDRWFRRRNFRRSAKYRPVSGETFILGTGRNGGNNWALMLDLLQMMMSIDLVDAKKVKGLVVYSQGSNASGKPPGPR